MGAHHELKAFQFQTDNGEFASRKCRDIVAERGGILVTNAPFFSVTMFIIERSWRIIGEKASGMLIHRGVVESFWEEATLYSVDIYNRMPLTRANGAGIRMTSYEKLHGVKPILNKLRPFGCRGFACNPVQGKSHKSRSQQVMWTRKDFKTIGGARFYHPPTNSCGTSGMSSGIMGCDMTRS